jgi:hypothetical protein
MEGIYVILGLAMIYSWVHGAIIVGKKIQSTTQYENTVLIFGLITFALYVIGTIY